MDHNWILLTKIPNLVQRGALEARFAEAQIETYLPDRDAIAQVGDTPNLNLGGYSAFFEGYSVFVRRDQLAQAQKILEEFEKTTYSQADHKTGIDYLSKFYLASYVSLVLPVVFHGVAFYNLYMAFKTGPVRISWGKMIFAWVVLIITGSLGYYALRGALHNWI